MKRQLAPTNCHCFKQLMPLLAAGFFFLSMQCAQAQAPVVSWLKTLGSNDGDYAHDIQPTTDGGYIVAGYIENKGGDVEEYHGNAGINDIWVVKLNGAGGIQWQRSLGTIYMQTGADVRQTPDGGYVVAGSSVQMECAGVTNYSLNFWLVKLSATGEVLWEKSFGGSRHEYLYGLDLTLDGGYILTGHSESTDGDVTGNHGDRDIWLVKVSNTGMLQWQKSLGGSSADAAYAVCTATDGGYIVAGTTESNNGDVNGQHGKNDFWVVKLTASGTVQWQKALGGSEREEALSVQATADGGCVLAGYSGSNDGDVSGLHAQVGLFSDYWVVKLGATGSLQWQRCFGGSFNERASSIRSTLDGGYIVAGSAESSDGDLTCNAGNTDMWVIKIGSIGQVQWQKSLGGTSVDEAYAVQPLPDGSFVVAGTTCSPNLPGYHVHTTSENTCGDFFIVKLSAPVVAAPVPSIVITPNTICTGAPATLRATALNVGLQPSYQWQRNGSPVGTNSPSYTAPDFKNNEVMVCTVSSGGACDNPNTSASARLVIKENSTVLRPTLSISASQNAVCTCTPVTFTATVANGGLAPVYRWKLNDVYTDGSTATYTAVIKPGDAMTCVYTDTLGCVAGGTLTSAPVVILPAAGLAPTISITGPTDRTCKGTATTFTATAINAGALPHYQWKVNNTNVGSNSNLLTTTTLTSGDVITCILQPDPLATCTPSGSITSNAVSVRFSEMVQPGVTVSTENTTVCLGSAAHYTALAANAGQHPSYAWQLNGQPVGANSNRFTNALTADGDQVFCKITTDPLFTCAASDTAVSKTVRIKVQKQLTPMVTASIDKNTFCSATPVTVTAVATEAGNAPAYKWMLNGVAVGYNPVYKSSSLHDGDVLYCELTPKDNVCTALITKSNSIKVIVHQTPTVRIVPADTAIAIASSVQFSTVVTGAVAHYVWSPANQLQSPISINATTVMLYDSVTYTLTVTSNNGCTGSGTAKVRVYKKLFMPNAFTPNGDGINDIFRIPPGVSITLKTFTIFDRWGKPVFTTSNPANGWDGNVKGVQLASGNYVYFIEGQNEKGLVLLKGNVMLLR